MKTTLPTPLAGRFPASAQFRINSPWMPQDYFWSGVYVLVSPRLAEALSDRVDAGELEFFPVRLLRQGAVLKGAERYYFLHHLHAVDATDRERSKLELIRDDWIDEVDRLVLKDEVLAPLGWCELARTSLGLTLVRDDIVERLRSGGFTGMIFEDPADYRSR